jgi:hypothetical protein
MPPMPSTGEDHRMRRRQFVQAALAALSVVPAAVAAPGGRVYRVGVLTPSPQQ